MFPDKIKRYLEDLRAFFEESSGKLAAAASALAGVLAFVSSDPSVAFLVSEMLPGPLRTIYVLTLVVVAYILPHWAKKKDETDHAED